MSDRKLEQFLKLILDQEKSAALTLQRAQLDCLQAESDLERAFEYQNEYLLLSEGRNQSQLAPIKIKSSRLFLTQVDALISHQKKLLESKRARQSHCREVFLAARTRKQTVESLIKKRESNRLLKQNKQEQQGLDDLFLAGWSG